MNRHVWLLVSLVFATGYWAGVGLVPPGAGRIVLKGGGVAALAVHAMIRSDAQTRPIALVMALGALGDVLIEANLVAGALAFLAGHGVACRFYGLRRPLIVASCAAVVAILAPLASGNPATAIYGLGLGAMLGCAWLSRFRRDLVGFGAVLFVVSDLALFARMGILAGSRLPGLLVWPTYYLGQMAITLGVVGV